jgi:hypothetical protein
MMFFAFGNICVEGEKEPPGPLGRRVEESNPQQS